MATIVTRAGKGSPLTFNEVDANFTNLNDGKLETTGGTLTGPVTITSGTQTVSTPALNMTQTWNNAATTFTGYKLNVTDTASNASSLLLQLQTGGSDMFTFRKNGIACLRFGFSAGPDVGAEFYSSADSAINRTVNNRSAMIGGVVSGIALASGYALNWSANSGSGADVFSNRDLLLTRKAAASLRLGAADAAAPIAQTFGVQSVVAGTTNTAGANFTIAGSQGTGTGAGGSIVFQVAPAGLTGSGQNALVPAMTIGSDRGVSVNGNITSMVGGAIQLVTTGTNPNANRGFIATTFSTLNLLTMASGWRLAWESGTSCTTSAIDVILQRDAANTLAQRNGVNAQAFRLYNTYTDASNYERGYLSWSSNQLIFGTQAAGTGSATRDLAIRATGNTFIDIGSNLNIRLANQGYVTPWQFNGTSGHLLCITANNTYDIGGATGNRPRYIYAGSAIVTPSTVVASLPAAATAGAGARSFVTDATATTFLSTVAGGGANSVPVVSDGTNWLIG